MKGRKGRDMVRQSFFFVFLGCVQNEAKYVYVGAIDADGKVRRLFEIKMHMCCESYAKKGGCGVSICESWCTCGNCGAGSLISGA